nr:MAG TPA: KilAC domain protein [Caudoviricetes sp.]
MNELQIFNNEEFGEIRTVVANNEPMFCLSDVCKALEISNVGNVKQRLSEKGIHTADTPTKGGMQKMTFISEANLYKTIFQSRKESAERFTDWVTSEVLPSIRKNGGYIAGQEALSDDELLSKALLVAHNKIAERDKIIEQKQARIEQMKPKAIFADAVATSRTSILIGDLAKLICQNGYQIGQKRLFEWLRNNGYLCKRKGTQWNMPTQKSMELGLFEVKESVHVNSNGCNIVTRTPKATGKAQIYFVNKFLGREIENGRND